jgi:hypothetical protein
MKIPVTFSIPFVSSSTIFLFLLVEAVREAFAWFFLDTCVSFQGSSFSKALFFGLVEFSYSAA